MHTNCSCILSQRLFYSRAEGPTHLLRPFEAPEEMTLDKTSEEPIEMKTCEAFLLRQGEQREGLVILSSRPDLISSAWILSDEDLEDDDFKKSIFTDSDGLKWVEIEHVENGVPTVRLPVEH